MHINEMLPHLQRTLPRQTDLDNLMERALEKLTAYRAELMGLLFQVTGMSDIMRGQASSGATATEQALKEGRMTMEEAAKMVNAYQAGLEGYTYLE